MNSGIDNSVIIILYRLLLLLFDIPGVIGLTKESFSPPRYSQSNFSCNFFLSLLPHYLSLLINHFIGEGRGKEAAAAYNEETLRYPPGIVERKLQKTFDRAPDPGIEPTISQLRVAHATTRPTRTGAHVQWQGLQVVFRKRD